jgi:hypothetical protein
MKGDPDADLPMKGTITGEIIQPMTMWAANKSLHIAYATVVQNHIGICLKIFDVFYTVLFITETANRYISGGLSDKKLRFLVIDPVARTRMETAFIDEIGRIARIMTGRGEGDLGQFSR